MVWSQYQSNRWANSVYAGHPRKPKRISKVQVVKSPDVGFQLQKLV